jgi:ribosomal protein S26
MKSIKIVKKERVRGTRKSNGGNLMKVHCITCTFGI